MKKLINTTLMLCLVFLVTACGEDNANNNSQIVTGKFGCKGTAAQVAECEKKGEERRAVPVDTESEGF